ncbi:MAG: hypothetical protein AAGC47_06310 [Bacteroidota bacterium]
MAKKDRFSELLSIFSALNKSERENALILARAFKNKSSKDSKEVANLIEEVQEINRTASLDILDPSLVKKKLSSSIISRAKDLILESLSLSQNIEKPGEYSNHFRNEIENQKKLNQAKIYLSRGHSTIAESLLLEVENKARKYELFGQVTETKELLALIYFQNKSAKTVIRYKEELAQARTNQHRFTEARNIFYNFDSEPIPIEEKLIRLKELEKNSRSVRVGFLRGLIEVEYLINQRKLNLANKVLNSLVESRRFAPPLQSSQGVSDLLQKLGEVKVKMGDLKGAYATFEEANQLVKNDTYESFVFRRNQILIRIYQGKLSFLDSEIYKRVGSTYYSRVPYASAFYRLLHSISLIYRKEYSKAAEALVSEIEYLQDATDREKFYRALYLFISGAELKLLTKQIGSKYCQIAINNLSGLVRGRLTQREILIIKVLKRITASRFDMRDYKNKNSESFSMLESKETDVSWIPLSDEIVPLENWIRHTLDRRKKLSKVNFG